MTSATIVIRFSDSSLHDLTLTFEDTSLLTLALLKRKIRTNVGGITLNRRLRLIYAGKIITDKTDLVKELDKATKIYQQVAERKTVSKKGKERESPSLVSPPVASKDTPSPSSPSSSGTTSGKLDSPSEETSLPKLYIHCSIGDILTPAELNKENELDSATPTRSTLPEQRGFDRLRNSGFTDQDITQLRRQFNLMYGAENAEEQTQMEDQWIDTGATDNAFSLFGGDYLDDVIGVLVGMFLGVIALYFAKERGIFNRRQQKGIVVGMIFNVSFAVIRMLT